MASGSQPGAQALAAAGGNGTALMLPPPPRPPKRKDIVLDEDEYTATLEAIIERDFFPELAKLQSKVAWLQAIRSGDPEQIRQAQLLIAQRRAAAAGGRPATGATPRGAPLFTPGGTAARAIAGNTPYIPPLPPGEPLRQPRPATGGGGGAGDAVGEAEELGVVAPPPVSLDSFLAVHTSEDNASFQEILETVNKKRRLKAAAQLAPQPDPKLLITDGRQQTDGFGTTGQQPDTLVPWRYQTKNALYYDGAQREALPYSDSELAAMVQGPPKAINHGGTRFPPQLAPSASATPSASSAGGGGGGVLSGNGGDGPSRAAAAAAAAAGTRGYSILATPSFDPGVEDTPLMTWGDIEGTPMRIEAEDLPPGPVLEGPSFYIREASRKDKAAQTLAAKAGASLRRKTGIRGSTPVVSGTLAAVAARRAGTGARPPTGRAATGGRPATGGGMLNGKPLSEAARRLASSMHRGRQGDADYGLRASYRGATPAAARPGTAARSVGSAASWSANPTPSRGRTPAGTPAVAATLEEEEARVQALLRRKQAEAQQREELEEAREAAKAALRQEQAARQPQPVVLRPGSGGGGGADGGGAAGSADLTAGLLSI